MLVAQLCLTLCGPVDCSLPGSSVHGILQARILEWVAILFSRGSSWSRNQTQISCIAGGFFSIWTIREAHCRFKGCPSWKRPSRLCPQWKVHSTTNLLHNHSVFAQTLPETGSSLPTEEACSIVLQFLLIQMKTGRTHRTFCNFSLLFLLVVWRTYLISLQIFEISYWMPQTFFLKPNSQTFLPLLL